MGKHEKEAGEDGRVLKKKNIGTLWTSHFFDLQR